MNDQNRESKSAKALGSCPLSEGQKALWFLTQVAPLSTSYNIYSTVQIKSVLDTSAWHRAWGKLIERHNILRTTYTNSKGQVVQKIKKEWSINISTETIKRIIKKKV